MKAHRNGSRRGDRSLGRLARALVRSACATLPNHRRQWGDAVLAELDAEPDGLSQFRFAASATLGLYVITAREAVHARIAHPTSVILAAALGLSAAVVDLTVTSRIPLLLLLGLGSLALGMKVPQGAWRWPVLTGGMLPLVILVTGHWGPYANDRGDAWYALVLSLFGTFVGVATARLWSKRRRSTNPAIVGLLVLASLALPIAATAAPDRLPQQAASMGDNLPSLAREDLEAFADSFFAPYLRDFPEPSLAVAVVYRDSVVLLKGYGQETTHPERQVDPDSTLFNIASVSKLFTATAAMQLVERGVLSLDEDVTQRMRGLFRGDGPRITLRHLLTHTSGIEGAFMRDVVAGPLELVSLRTYFERFPPRRVRAPGGEIRYSNVGMGLVGRLVEIGAGKTFDDYIEQNIFAPLDMRRSSFRQPPPPALLERVATAGCGPVPDAIQIAPAGAMVSTVADMSRFMRAHLNEGSVDGNRILAPETVRTMHRVQWRAADDVPGVALGFFTSDLGDIPGLFHTGARVHFSLLYLVPEHGLGVFVVHAMRQGGPHQSLRTDFVRALISRYFPASETKEATSTHGEPDPSLTSPQEFAGTYRPIVFSTSTIERAAELVMDTRVVVDAHRGVELGLSLGPRLALRSVNAAHYRVHGGPMDGLHVAFLSDASGRVTGLATSGNTNDPVTFVRLRWFERGTVHAVFLGVIAIQFAGVALVSGLAYLQRLIRRLGTSMERVPPGPGAWAWRVLVATGALVLTAPLSTVLFVVTHQGEDMAADGLRFALRAGLSILLVGSMTGLALPSLALRAWQEEYWGRARRVYFSVLAASVLVALPLLYHYRLLGYWL